MSNKIINLPHNFALRWYQREVWNAFFNDEYKKFNLVWHRRAGKDDLCINICAAYGMSKPMYILYLLPQQNQARKVIWRGKTDDGITFADRIPADLIKRKSSVEMTVELINGTVIQLAGSDNYNSLMGTNPSLIIHSEYALSNPSARQYLRPILVRNGGKEIVISTPRGMGHHYHLYQSSKNSPDWYTSLLTVNDTYDYQGIPLITKEMMAKEKQDGAREESIQSEYFCSFEAAVIGAYYAKQLRDAYEDGRIKQSIPINPGFPVVTSWDLGFSDSTAIWIIQIVNEEINVLCYYENSGQPFDHYASFIKDFSIKNRIKYSFHIAPHDINKTELFGTGKSRLEIAKSMGILFTTVPRTKDVTEDIEIVRSTFKSLYFDSNACANGLSALSQYRADYSSDLNIYSSKPVHDWSSHGSDSLRAFCVWYSASKLKNKNETFKTKIYNPFS